MRPGSGNKNVDRLNGDVDGGRDEGPADDPHRSALTALVTGAEKLPDHHRRGQNLDQRIKPEGVGRPEPPRLLLAESPASELQRNTAAKRRKVDE